MHKLFLLTAISALIISCNSNSSPAPETKDTTVAVVTEEAPVNFLYPSAYPSDWKIGDPKNILKVQELYKIMLSDSNYEAMKPYFADTVTNIMFDNRKIRLSAEQFINNVKQFRKGYKTLDEDFRNYVSLRSDSQNIDMVMLWLKEKGVRSNGKVDSSGYQETWRFNKDGKIDYRSTYVRFDF
ncbi:MAG TPA: hypothetical protein VK166_17875 [Chitinophagaceae bacterium]|nr:hypothetical protein [Chitinophagaceae bacterium]